MSYGTCQLSLLVRVFVLASLARLSPPGLTEFFQQQPVFCYVFFRVHLMFDVLHTVLNSGLVHTLPIEQASSVQQILFSRGDDPYIHACKARPSLTDVGLL